MFGNTVTYTAKTTIKETLLDLQERQLGFVPIENSTHGSVIETYDALRQPRMGSTGFVRAEHILAIKHCLVGAKGATLSGIKSISSHEQVRKILGIDSHSSLTHDLSTNPFHPGAWAVQRMD